MRLSTRLLIPWALFCAILVTGFTYFQSQFNQVQTELNLQLQLMQDSVRYARELRFLSQERLTLAMGYREGPLAPVFNELTASENRTNTLILHFEELLTSNAKKHSDEVYGYQGLYLLKIYALARQNLPKLYREWLETASQHSALEPVKRTQLNQLFMTVRASLDDLAEFHEISEQLITAEARKKLRNFQISFYFSMGFMLLLLLGFSFYQGQSIASPLNKLSKDALALTEGKNAHFETRSEITEVKHLSQAMTDMVKKLQTSHQEVMRQEERFQKVIHAAPIAMIVVDSQARIVLANPATEKMFGYPAGILEGRLIESLVPESLRAPHVDLRTEFIQEPTARFIASNRNIRGQRADGTSFPIEIGLNPIQTAEGPMVMAIAVDTTDKLALEQERHAYQKRLESDVVTRTAELTHKTMELELAIKDLESFSYSVSHDLRAPLRAIDGFVQILLDDHASQLDADGHRMFSIVQENARRMGQLIDDILAFSRAGRLEMDWQDIDMNRLLQEVWSSVSATRPDHGTVLDAQPLPRIKGDPRAVRQILSNLLDNAIKFSRQKQPGHVKVTATTEGNMVRFSVQDNGVGFNPEFSNKLFVMFQRLHGVNEFEGTGVGLAIVKRFVIKHGGQVSAAAQLGEGATFSFTLPTEIPVGLELQPDQPKVPVFR
jgi:PAS domain S-box-containing protein